VITDEKEAQRRARHIVSDVMIYNDIKVKEGIENDNLFEVLREELEEGRQHFLGQVEAKFAYVYDLAIVDVLVKQRGHINSTIW